MMLMGQWTPPVQAQYSESGEGIGAENIGFFNFPEIEGGRSGATREQRTTGDARVTLPSNFTRNGCEMDQRCVSERRGTIRSDAMMGRVC